MLAVTVAIFTLPCFASVKSESIKLSFSNEGHCCYVRHHDATRSRVHEGPSWGIYGPYYPAGYFSAPAKEKGTVKLVGADKDADVYIDSAYAGKASDLKTISIKPGKYSFELHLPGGEAIKTKIYVSSGRTCKLEF